MTLQELQVQVYFLGLKQIRSQPGHMREGDAACKAFIELLSSVHFDRRQALTEKEKRGGIPPLDDFVGL